MIIINFKAQFYEGFFGFVCVFFLLSGTCFGVMYSRNIYVHSNLACVGIFFHDFPVLSQLYCCIIVF